MVKMSIRDVVSENDGVDSRTASFHEAVKGYTEALLWANTYHEVRIGDTLDGELEQYGSAHCEFSFSDFSEDDQEVIRSTVVDFIESNREDYNDYLNGMARFAYSPNEMFGHDLLLTRSGHGTGFWDRGLGELGDRLTEAAKVYGETNAEVRDGKVFLVES